MKLFNALLKSAFLAVLMISFTGCEKEELNEEIFEVNASVKVKAPTAEKAGNNLSFPVIWAEGIEKTLRTAPAGLGDGEVLLEGAWWFVWGPEPADPSSPIYSCAPSPSNELLCADETDPGTLDPGLYKGWVQKDAKNYWEAYNANAEGEVTVDYIDWGDNLESIDWSIQSQVRTELVLYKVLDAPVLQYPMRHVSGWGITEVHGLQTDTLGNIQFQNAPGDQATVYSTHTRMTIQKLNVDRDDPRIVQIKWDEVNNKWTDTVEDDILVINEPILSNALYEAADGPGYFNAEVNVKGKIMYGYTWDLKKLNEGTGSYRITYSFDGVDTTNLTSLNTLYNEFTEIIVAEEEEEVVIAGEGESGGVGVLDVSQNLTYMDIRIIGRTTGGGGGNSGGGNGGGKPK